MKSAINFLLLAALFLTMTTTAFCDTATDYFSSGNAKQSQGDLNGAIADYNKAIELNPDLVAAYKGRGLAKQIQGDLDGAIKDYTEAIEVRPDDAAGLYLTLGFVKGAKGDLDGALTDLGKVAELINRGLAKSIASDLDETIADYTKAIKRRPDDAGLYVARGYIKQMVRNDSHGPSKTTLKPSNLSPITRLPMTIAASRG